MRVSIMAMTVGVVISAGAMSAPAGAMPAGNPGVGAALGTGSVEQVACWRFGSHGWGWYPFCGPPPRPPAYAAWDYAPPPPPNCRDTTVRERHWEEVEVHHYRQCY
jgi:hypothetical protein